MMTIRRLKRILALAIASLAAVVPLGPGTTVAQVPLGSLKTVPVPKPDLTGFVRDEATAIKLGKALFWDMQVGSDGIQSCGTCHFHAGADHRIRNQLHPGHDGVMNLIGNSGGANYTLAPNDFPFHRLAVPDDRTSLVLGDRNDRAASQGAGPPLSGFEMSAVGRNWKKVGKKMLSLTPLGKQKVDPSDSVLGSYAEPKAGLTVKYGALIQQAFAPAYWNSLLLFNLSG